MARIGSVAFPEGGHGQLPPLLQLGKRLSQKSLCDFRLPVLGMHSQEINAARLFCNSHHSSRRLPVLQDKSLPLPDAFSQPLQMLRLIQAWKAVHRQSGKIHPGRNIFLRGRTDPLFHILYPAKFHSFSI